MSRAECPAISQLARKAKNSSVLHRMDGSWAACELEEGKLVTMKEIILDPEKPEVFLAWLDRVVALKSSLPPEPLTIRADLGQDWVAFRRSSAALASLWERLSSSPQVALKRQLWAQLLNSFTARG